MQEARTILGRRTARAAEKCRRDSARKGYREVILNLRNNGPGPSQ
jgi:hypothetical protein